MIYLGMYYGEYLALVSSDLGEEWNSYSFPSGSYENLAIAKAGTKILYFSQNGVVTIFNTQTWTFTQDTINNKENGTAIDDGNNYAFFIGENSNIIDAYDSQTSRWTTIDVSIGRSNFGATVVYGNLIIAGKVNFYCIFFVIMKYTNTV
jgi:hypothetical protein